MLMPEPEAVAMSITGLMIMVVSVMAMLMCVLVPVIMGVIVGMICMVMRAVVMGFCGHVRAGLWLIRGSYCMSRVQPKQ